MPGLDTLLPEYQSQYEAMMPEIERKVRADLVRRGMSYSGNAGDTLARAQAQLLADLAGKSAESRIGQQESTRQRQFLSEQNEASRRESQRAQRLGLVGSTIGGLGTLGALYAMRPQGGGGGMENIFRGENGELLRYDPATGTTYPVPAASAPQARPAPPMSMWQKAKTGLPSYAAGAAGGLAGQQLAQLIGGRESTEANIGAGLGGLGGLMAAQKFASGNPWAAGLGALLGSTGGGLLGNLFR